MHARNRIGGVGELLARAGPVDHCAVLDQDDIGRSLEVAPLTFGQRTKETQQRFKLPCGDGSAASTPARPIVSRSCSAAGQSAASTMECTGMRKDAQASPGPQAVADLEDLRKAADALRPSLFSRLVAPRPICVNELVETICLLEAA